LQLVDNLSDRMGELSNGYWWSIFGLVLDITGASLLAVEAIKLENLRKLAEGIRMRVELPLESPLFMPEDPESEVWKIPTSELRARGFAGRHRLYTAAHIFAGWVGLFTVNMLIRAFTGYDVAERLNSWILSRSFWIAALLYLLLGIVVGLWMSWLVGEGIIHGVAAGSIRGILRLLSFVDKKTPTGTTGIIGFVLMFCGFAGQIMATIVNG
jgi:hypothetical protein